MPCDPVPPTSVRDIARMIDHSLLHPTLTPAQVEAGCRVARRCECATVCVQPTSVALAARLLADSATSVCAVAGFPHGASHPETKRVEAVRAMEEGAAEIDVVVNLGHVLGGQWGRVTDEVLMLNTACRKRGALLKVIFENDFLETEHIIQLCEICTEAGVAFIKTSTGYGFVKQPGGDYNYRGATDIHLRLMRAHSGRAMQIKAAGGVRTLDDVLRVRALGVTRIGATATESILAAAMQRGLPRPWPEGWTSDATR